MYHAGSQLCCPQSYEFIGSDAQSDKSDYVFDHSTLPKESNYVFDHHTLPNKSDYVFVTQPYQKSDYVFGHSTLPNKSDCLITPP